MANNDDNRTKNAGFFCGATELAQYLVTHGEESERKKMDIEARQKILNLDGQNYRWNTTSNLWEPIKPVSFIPDDPIIPAPYTLFTLDGLIDYIRENVEGLIPEGEGANRLILQVTDHHNVRLMSHPSQHHKKRSVIAECTAHVPDIKFDVFMDTEMFNTQLLSKFIDTPARAELFKVVQAMTKEQSCNTTDDGISQVITVKQGVSMAANVTFKNPVPLMPMRTFSEIEQPESNFTLRVNDDARCALYEADGGAWKNEAVARIKGYLKDSLIGHNVVVIA